MSSEVSIALKVGLVRSVCAPGGGVCITGLSLSRTSLCWCTSPSGELPVKEVMQTRLHILAGAI